MNNKLLKNLLLGNLYLKCHLNYVLGLIDKNQCLEILEEAIREQQSFTSDEIEQAVCLLLEFNVEKMTYADFCYILNLTEDEIKQILAKLIKEGKIKREIING